jgi:hypothetical protein
MKKQTFIDKCIKDKNGKVVFWQTPNGPLMVWAFFEVLNEFVARGVFQGLCSAVAFGALFTWAWLEITSGVNYARRALGLAVMIFSIYAKIK